MFNLNRYLPSPLDDFNFFSLVFANLHPDYQRELNDKQIRSIEDILEHGRKYELLLSRISGYRPPPSTLTGEIYGLNHVASRVGNFKNPVNSNLIRQPRVEVKELSVEETSSVSEEDIIGFEPVYANALKKPAPVNSQIKILKSISVSNSDKSDSRVPFKAKFNLENAICYNCLGKGHLKTDCTEEYIKRCYGCFKEGVTKNDCPNCGGRTSVAVVEVANASTDSENE